MTSAEQVELLPCPLCNASLHWHPPHVLNTGHWTHPTGACALRAFVLSADDAEAWNHRASLARVSPQPVAEPVAWLVEWNRDGEEWVNAHANEVTAIDEARAYGGKITPLYPHPDAEPEQRGRLAGIEAIERSRELPIHSASVDFVDGVRYGIDRAVSAIRALAQPQESSL